MRQHETGIQGEARAEAYLSGKGMICIARRYRAMDGEIDLVMLDGGTVVFVEVKARTAGSLVRGAEAVTRAKMVKLVKTAMDYLYKNEINIHETYLRFDIAEVTLERCSDLRLLSFRYLEDAFSPSTVGLYL